ncbi:MAG: glycosyltransferase [Coriobacteriia bacterium]|nr:glycosyltransferase [Coriobacteriia bacterium]
MEKPAVSIVVPLYNKAAYVEQCLQSLAAQTLREIEVIVIDDGSTDGGGEVAMAFCESDKRFRCIRQDNAGVSAALNRGLALACGTYIGRVDADDWVEPKMYERLYDTAVSSDAALVRCGYLRAYTDGTTREMSCCKVPEQRNGLWCFEKLFGKVFVPFMSTALGIYHRDTLKAADITYPVELNNLEDIFFNARFYALDLPVALIPDCLYHYREDPDSASQKPPINLREQFDTFDTLMRKQVLDVLSNTPRYKKLRAAYGRYRRVARMSIAADMTAYGVGGIGAQMLRVARSVRRKLRR